MKAVEVEMRKRIMVRMPNMDVEEEVVIMNPDSSSGIYVTASVESQFRLIAHIWNVKEEEKINNTNVNALKMDAHMNQRAKSFLKIVANLPNDMMYSEATHPYFHQDADRSH